MEEDNFSGEEPSDDTDHQRLHETILSLEKSLEEAPESQNVSKTLASEDVKENVTSYFTNHQSDDVDAPLPEQELSSAQTSNTMEVTEPEASLRIGNNAEEDQAALVQESRTAKSPPPKGSPVKDKVAHEVSQSPQKDRIAHEAHRSPSKGVSKSPVKADEAHKVSQSPEKSEGGHEGSQSPKKGEVGPVLSRSPEKAEVRCEGSQSPEKAEVASDVSRSPEKGEVYLDIRKSPVEAEVSGGVSRSPEKAEVASDVSRSPEKGEVYLDVRKGPENAEVARGLSRSPEKAEVASDVSRSPKKGEVYLDATKSPEKAEVARGVSRSPEKAEVAHDINRSPEKAKLRHEVSESSEEDEVPHQLQPSHEEVVQVVTSLGNFKPVVDLAYLKDSQSLGDISPRKKQKQSPEKEVVHDGIEVSEGDDLLNEAKKLKTPPKEIKEIDTPKVVKKKRGRPSLADKLRQSNLANFPEKVNKPKKSPTTRKEDITDKSTTTGKEGITCKTNKSTTTTGKEDITSKTNKSLPDKKHDSALKYTEQKPLRRPKTDDSTEDISLFLPEDWIFMAVVRQAGAHSGHLDLYYWTPPPRVKLRSRLELLAYLNKHGLNYDPLKFFIKSHIPFLLKTGALKYYDSKTIVPSDTDDTVLSQLIPLKKAPRGSIQTESAIKISRQKTEKPEKTINKIIKKQKSLLQKNKRLKRKYTRRVQSKFSPRTKSNVSPELDLRKARERNTGSTIKSPAESVESVGKELKGSNTVTIKSEVTSPDTSRKTRLRSSTCVVQPPVISPVRATKRSSQVLETVESVPSPKTPVKNRPGRPRKTVLPPPPPPPPPSDTHLEQRVIIQSKPKTVRSPYFPSSSSIVEQPISSAGRKKDKNSDSAPPRSPFNLIQEDLFHDPWQMLISTIFLNSTSGRIAIPLALEFLKRWPTPQEACQAKLNDILDVVDALGFGRTRAAIIIRFSHEFLTKDWKLPSDLYGIGKYGTDSYKIFCMKNAWKKVESDDPLLMMYLNWRRATEHLRKKFLNSRKNPRAVDPDEKVVNPAQLKQTLNALQATQNEDQSLPSPRKRLRTRTK